MTPPSTTKPAPPHRMSLSAVVERLTERGGATSTASLKTMTTGPLAGHAAADVQVAAGATWDDVKLMTAQASWAYTELLAQTIGAHAELPADTREAAKRTSTAKAPE